MLRNLDWLYDLDVQYDASTFDTDHLSRSQTDVTLCFRSGCHAQMTIALLLYNQCVTALQEVTLSFPTLSRRIPHGGNLFDRIRDASG